MVKLLFGLLLCFGAAFGSGGGPISNGAATWKPSVGTLASLPASGNTTSDVRATDDTQALYVWSGSAWVQVGGTDTSGIARDGSRAPTAAISWNSQNLTGVAALTATTVVGSTSVTSALFSSSGSTPATAGTIRLPYAELIEWRDSTNAGNVTMTVGNSSGGFINYLKLGGSIVGIDLGNNSSLSRPALLIADDSGFYRAGANHIAASCAGTKCFDLTASQMGLPAFLYMNVGGTAGTTSAIATNTTTDKLILAGDPFGDLARGGAVELGSRSGALGEVANIYAAGTKMVSVSSTGAGLFGFIDALQIATPSNPAASHNRLYFKSDNNLYMKNSAGTETQVNGGGGGSFVATDGSTPLTANWAVGAFNLTGIAGIGIGTGSPSAPNVPISVTESLAGDFVRFEFKNSDASGATVLRALDSSGEGFNLATYGGGFSVSGFRSPGNSIVNATGGTDLILVSKFGAVVVASGSDTSTSSEILRFETTGMKTTSSLESTGAGTALLGAANSPATVLSAPYKWISSKTSDGTVVYYPVWK